MRNSCQCVKDGIHLSENGFYVLLKSKKTSCNAVRILENQINHKDYDIVAQSYAWKTNNGNLCLDSIEWNIQRITFPIIQDLMTQFSRQVFHQNPDIKYINVGKSGQTPNDIGKLVKLSETMKQGFQYGDSQEQLQIASRINSKKVMALEKRLSSYSEAFKNAVLYIAPYFSALEIRGLPQILFEKNPNIENELYPFLQRCHLPSHLCAEDFRRMSFADYQHLNEEDKANVLTVCKILNSSNEEQLENWLPSVPDEELALISLIQYPYSFGFQLKALTRLPVNELLSILYEQDVSQQSILIKSLSSSEVLKIIFERCPDKKSRFDVIVKTRNLLVEALSYPESLKILLDLYPTDEDCLEMIKQKDKFGECILFKAASHP